MRRPVGVALSLALLLLGACEEDDAFHCLEDAQCGVGGVCELNSSCSFEDSDCESGRRYGQLSPEGIANACVPIEDLAESPAQDESVCARESSSCDACVSCALEGGPCADSLWSCADFDVCVQNECASLCGDALDSVCEE